ncbi:hypothetical protein GGF32_006193 [Allomyces javanicus]|nr:hypothetical protein GGF32_006193 [Allomyces javanicus]
MHHHSSNTHYKLDRLVTWLATTAAHDNCTKDLFQQSAAASSAATSAAKDLLQLQLAAAKNLLEERSASAKDLFHQSAAPLLASSPDQQLVHQPVFSSVPITSIFSALESVTPARLIPGTVPIVENAHDDESITLDEVSSRTYSIFESAAPTTEPVCLADAVSVSVPVPPAAIPEIDAVAHDEPVENGDGPAPATSTTVDDAPAHVGIAKGVSVHDPEESAPALDAPTRHVAPVEDRNAVILAALVPEVDAPALQAQPGVVEAPVQLDHVDVDVPVQPDLAVLDAPAQVKLSVVGAPAQVELSVTDAPVQAERFVADTPVQQADRADFDAPSPDDPTTTLLVDAPSVEPITDDVIPTRVQPDLEPITPPAEPVAQGDRNPLLLTPVASPRGSLVDDKPVTSRRVSQLSSFSSRRSSRASKTSSMILQGHHELASTWIEKPDGTRVLQRRIVLHDSPTYLPATAPAIAPAAEPANDAEPSLAAPSPRSSMDLRRASTIMPNVINVMATTMPPTTFPSGESALTVTKAADSPKYPKDPKSIHALPAHRREACSLLAPEADLQSYRGLMDVAVVDAELGADQPDYPRYITVANLVEFLSFPTLCYQPKYPRIDRVHVGKIIKYALQTAAAIVHMRPIVESTYAALTDPVTGDVHWTNASPVFLLERTLTLTPTIIYFWLTMFFGMFHAASNLQAELTRFADREFYLDWWNCSTIGAYWRLWNQPVHQWLKRHVYIPLVAGKWLPDPHHPPGALPDLPRGEIVGVSKQTAGLVCFFVSAVFHELLIAVPTKLVWMVGFGAMIRFGAMIVQVPLMAVSEKWDKKYRQWKPDGVNMLGNLLMWITFCLIGHPTAVMLYYVGWCAREHCVVALA